MTSPKGTLGHSDVPKSFVADPTANKLLFQFLDPGTRPSMDELKAFAARHRVDRIVSVAGDDAYPTDSDLHAFGSVQEIAGVYVAPACGRPSLHAQ
jgi:hypothetical protein